MSEKIYIITTTVMYICDPIYNYKTIYGLKANSPKITGPYDNIKEAKEMVDRRLDIDSRLSYLHLKYIEAADEFLKFNSIEVIKDDTSCIVKTLVQGWNFYDTVGATDVMIIEEYLFAYL